MKTLTLEDLRKVSSELLANRVKPRTVQTEEEAQRLTESDPVGHVWHVGEEYFIGVYSCS